MSFRVVFPAGTIFKINTDAEGSIVFEASSADIAPRAKPGPKSLVKSEMKSTEFHAPILSSLRDGPKSSEDIRKFLDDRFGSLAATNTVSWALVELQNEGARRGRGLRQTGPVEKVTKGFYRLRG